MIDIHSHIVFAVDDGPKTIEESLSLIEESYRQGVRTIVSTSHRRKGMFETPEDIIAEHFQKVKEEAETRFPDLTLLYGGELYYTPDIVEKLENRLVPRLNGSRFALLEFSMGTPWKTIQEAVSNFLMIGVTPVLAHIERYNALEFNKQRVQELINMGCYTQVNATHVLKPKLFGDKLKVFKKRAQFFLDENLVHIISSDMHNLDKRPPFMEKAHSIIVKKYGSRRAKRLFETNAATLLSNNFLEE